VVFGKPVIHAVTSVTELAFKRKISFFAAEDTLHQFLVSPPMRSAKLTTIEGFAIPFLRFTDYSPYFAIRNE
jgi:hypothetical protein